LAEVNRCGNSPLVADDGLHKFELASWLLDKPIDRIGAWIDSTTPLDAPAFVRMRFAAAAGAAPQYGQLDFNFSPKLDIPSDLWLDDFVEIFGEHGVMWINQCAGAGTRSLFRGNEMSSSPAFPPIAVFRGGKVTTYLTDLSPAARSWSTSFVACTRHFVDVIRHGGQPVCTGEAGKQLNRYAIAALLSAQEGRDVDVSEVTTEAEVAGRIALHTNFCNNTVIK
jgi:predicted dehydrogenase